MIQEQNEFYKFIVDSQSSLTRLDKLLCLYLPMYTRNKLTVMIDNGSVTVNGNLVAKNHKVKSGDIIEITAQKNREYNVIPENIEIQIVYEDDDIIVVNKPKGMVVHPAHGNTSGTLVNALMYHCKGSLSGINGVMRPGIVHRIDKDTSGLLVIAKNDFSHNSLAEQFKAHSIEREYRAIVYGNVKNDSGTIDKPIGRHPINRKMMACIDKNSKNAVTHYKVIARYNGFTYISCRLETGRTHQIRVHMSNMGHFLVGDEVYGKKINKINLDFKGQCLHAKTLGFIHPKTGENIRFESDLPDYFSSTLKKITYI